MAWGRMSEDEQAVFLDDWRAAFQRRNHIEFAADRATRVELGSVDRPNCSVAPDTPRHTRRPMS
jgi:hypothetical protein